MYDGRELIVSTSESTGIRFCLSGNDACDTPRIHPEEPQLQYQRGLPGALPQIRELLPFDFANSFLAHLEPDRGSSWPITRM